MSAPLRAHERIESPPPAAVTLVRGTGSRNAKILVIDDHEANIEALKRILRRAGFASVNCATDPIAGVALVSSWMPDLILLDLHMPQLDGFGVLEAIRPHLADGSYLPVLMLTADSSDETKRRALAAGVKDFLTKPFDATEVLLRIENLLETRFLYTAVREQNQLLEQRVTERTRELEEAQIEILERLAAAAEFRDDDTGQHTHRVGELAALLASEIGLSTVQVELVRRAAPLHDVGKIGIPDSILLKAGRLTKSERRIMETHVTIGASMLNGGRSPLVQTAERIARSHHERWDGKGYPDCLSGKQIPIEARVVSVADFLDALTHDRPYRRAWAVEKTLAAIVAERAGHFDPAVVDALLAMKRVGRY
ncbi:MAG TPA: HD domain-containing phosphohydrolase [Gemmatimonadaceae bacterium]|nr:HD domain-containing phosphohydrolase [Gemmatimonadaceae bacterium]